MPHQDTVLLIWVFSIFGLVLVLMIGSFYACHLYAQRLERLNPMPAAQAQQVGVLKTATIIESVEKPKLDTMS